MKRERLMTCLLFGILLVFALFWAAGCRKPEPGQAPPPAREEPRILDPLTGRQVKRVVPLLAVMVDNLAASRPQTGLGEAGVVYEIEAEGGITRFLALYAGDPPENVGPVRSARTYFLHLVQEWDAYFAHIGGSADALANIRSWGIEDLDDFKNSPGFWRDRTRRAPHNAYLNVARALAGKAPKGLYRDWVFQEAPAGPPDYREVSFCYGRGYRVTYRFSPERKEYLRFINGVPHTDRITGRQLAAANVVLQYAPHTYLGDALGHIEVGLIGRGEAEFFLAGKHLEGTWEKPGALAPTKFYDREGREIRFVRGSTWIHVLRPGAPVTRNRPEGD
ncbi:MAG: DUF3048 domain-containing protein [Firmicutes bacterium]|nr:DUF3048 domain-containing protein [Bacillota bacterium]